MLLSAAEFAAPFSRATLRLRRQSRRARPKLERERHASPAPRRSNRAHQRVRARRHPPLPRCHRLRASRREIPPILSPFVSSSASRKIVNRWLAFRPDTPPAMHPNPLIRIFPNNVFNYLRETLRIFPDVAL